MNKLKQLAAMILMVCGMMVSMASCDKENSEENGTGIVGTWQMYKVDFSFDGELVYTEREKEVLVFTDDGLMFFGDEDYDDVSEYFYTPGSNELTLMDSYGQETLRIERLTSSELVISETVGDSYGQNYIDYSCIGESVDRFNGLRIYEYNLDREHLHCYKKDGKYYICDELEDGTYYDCQTIYYKRIK